MKSKLVTSLALLSCAFSVLANTPPSLLAAPGYTQLVVIMNDLANPNARDHTKSDVTVKYYDGSGNHPPCWIEYKIAYHGDPNVAGAGGRNACGVSGAIPAAIVRIDIIPLKTVVGKVYEDLLDVKVDANKFYNALIIEQDQPPVYHSDGKLKMLGKLRVKSVENNN